MEQEEIFPYIKVGIPRAISVGCRELEQYPGIIRTLVILENAEIQLNFLDQGSLELNEGEVTFYFCYKNYEKLFEAIEIYLEIKMENWTNYNRSGWYPDTNGIDTEKSWNDLVYDFVNGKLKFPKGYQKFRIASLYWQALYSKEIKPNDPFDVFDKWIREQIRKQDKKEKIGLYLIEHKSLETFTTNLRNLYEKAESKFL